MEPNSRGLLRVWPRQCTETHSLSTTWGVVGFPPSLAHLKTTLSKNNYHKNTDTQCTDSQAEERVLRDRRGRVSGPLWPQRETGTVSKELHDVFSSLLFCPLGIALPNVSQKDLGLFWSLKPNKSFLNYLNRTFTLVFPTAWKCPVLSTVVTNHILGEYRAGVVFNAHAEFVLESVSCWESFCSC